jgi:hypothetical protein
MKRYRMALASVGGAEMFDLVCANDEEALLACHDRSATCAWVEAWDGARLVCRWERAAGRRA